MARSYIGDLGPDPSATLAARGAKLLDWPGRFIDEVRAPVVSALLALALAGELGLPAFADQRYSVSGSDRFTIGAGDIQSEVDYRGSQTLTVTRHGHKTRYVARVDYVRSDQGSAIAAKGDYVAELLPTGETLDSADHDPDYLTLLNQPFAVRLDAATLSDLRRLQAPLPFDVPSPFTGSTLHGHLRRISDGRIGLRQAIGVRFDAGGRMRGALPDRPGLTLVGGIAMRGSAYYDLESALLLALDATVTISGTVSNRASNDPVTIVYRRKIRAEEPTTTSTASH